MKATELMIGDWVLVKGKPTRVTDVTKFEGINREWIVGCEDGGCIREEDIEPILLTEEILEKNGYERVEGFPTEEAYFIDDDGDFDPYLVVRSFDFNESFALCTTECHMSVFCIAYVHEFQHLLKLCDINKEIIL